MTSRREKNKKQSQFLDYFLSCLTFFGLLFDDPLRFFLSYILLHSFFLFKFPASGHIYGSIVLTCDIEGE